MDSLIDDGWVANKVALVTTNKRHRIHQDYFESWHMVDYCNSVHAEDAEFYGHVLWFEGSTAGR